MNNEYALQLLNAELDGELDATARAELQALLAVQPELQREREALARLAATLHEVPDLDPPPGFAARVARSIRLPARKHLLQVLTGWLKDPIAVPATAFAAGILVTVGAYQAIPAGLFGANASQVMGSMVRESTHAGLTSYSTLQLQLGDLSGRITLGASAEDTRLLEFELDSDTPIDIAIDLGASGLSFEDLAALDPGIEVIERHDGAVRLRASGEHYFAVALRAGETDTKGSVRLAFYGGGKPLYGGALGTP